MYVQKRNKLESEVAALAYEMGRLTGVEEEVVAPGHR